MSISVSRGFSQSARGVVLACLVLDLEPLDNGRAFDGSLASGDPAQWCALDRAQGLWFGSRSGGAILFGMSIFDGSGANTSAR